EGHAEPEVGMIERRVAEEAISRILSVGHSIDLREILLLPRLERVERHAGERLDALLGARDALAGIRMARHPRREGALSARFADLLQGSEDVGHLTHVVSFL